MANVNRRDQRTAQSEFMPAVYRVVLTAAAVICVAAALAIPGYYETTTLWYKTGVDKAMLIAGQYCGLTALMLVYLQVLLAIRGDAMSAIFGAANLIRYHRINGAFVALAAVSHALLVLVPEGIANLPLGKKFWPEMVGAAVLFFIVLLAVSSYLRNRLHIPFAIWRALHRPAGYGVLLLATVHVLFVSESFEKTGPRLLIGALFLSVAALWGVKHYRSVRNNKPSSPQ
jgi:predicted ferric reductase